VNSLSFYNVGGEMKILDETEKGRQVLNRLQQADIDGNVRIMTADLSYCWAYDDTHPDERLPYSAAPKGWNMTMCYGFTWTDENGQKFIYLHNDMNEFVAAWTMIHEAAHHFAIPQQPGESDDDHTRRIEGEAHQAEAEWIAEYLNCDDPPAWVTDRKIGEALLGAKLYKRYLVDKEFFTRKDGKWLVDRKAIDDYVERVYITPTSSPAYRRTKYAYEGPPETGARITLADK
jgi:hypothetical protein